MSFHAVRLRSNCSEVLTMLQLRRPLTEDCLREIDGTFELRSGNKTKGRITVALKWVQVLSHVVAQNTGNELVPHSVGHEGAHQALDAWELENAAVLELILSTMNVKVLPCCHHKAGLATSLLMGNQMCPFISSYTISCRRKF